MNLVKKMAFAIVLIGGVTQQAHAWLFDSVKQSVTNNPSTSAGVVIGAATGIGLFRNFMNRKVCGYKSYDFSLTESKESSLTQECKNDIELLKNKYTNFAGDSVRVEITPSAVLTTPGENAGCRVAYIKLGNDDQSKNGKIYHEGEKPHSYQMRYKHINGFINKEGKFVPLRIAAVKNWEATRWVTSCKKGKCLAFTGFVGTSSLIGGFCGYAYSKLVS